MLLLLIRQLCTDLLLFIYLRAELLHMMQQSKEVLPQLHMELSLIRQLCIEFMFMWLCSKLMLTMQLCTCT